MQSSGLKMNKCHDEKQKTIAMSKLEPSFAKTLERIKNNQEEKMGENYWCIQNL